MLFLFFCCFLLFKLLLFLLLLSSFLSILLFLFSFCFGFSSLLNFGSSFSFSGNFLFSFSSYNSFLLCEHLLLGFLVFIFLDLEFFFLKSNFLQIHSLFSFHLLFNFKHLQLSLSFSSWKFMLSLQSSQVSFGSSLFSSSSFSFLNSLCR